jgi:hypothetical protein
MKMTFFGKPLKQKSLLRYFAWQFKKNCQAIQDLIPLKKGLLIHKQ